MEGEFHVHKAGCYADVTSSPKTVTCLACECMNPTEGRFDTFRRCVGRVNTDGEEHSTQKAIIAVSNEGHCVSMVSHEVVGRGEWELLLVSCGPARACRLRWHHVAVALS